MQVIDPGHEYCLTSLDGEMPQTVTFVKRFRGAENHPGTTNQELLRVLIDRVKFLHAEKPHEVNNRIVYHLRMALVLHETRALERKVEKNELKPENVAISEEDGHFTLSALLRMYFEN